MKAIIFDFDGLILDTETPDYVSWQEVYRAHGFELPREKWLSIIGGTAESDFEPHEYLEALTGAPVDREQIWVARRKSYLEHLEGQPVLPGVVEMIQAVKQRGLKLAIASSSPENWVSGHLNRLGLLPHFDVVVTADEVEETKPNPALFLLAAERLGVAPRDVLVFEDSQNGVLGAKRAQMFVVAVPNPVTAASDLSAADLRLNSLAEITLDALLAQANPSND